MMLTDKQKAEALGFAMLTIEQRMNEHRAVCGDDLPDEEWIQNLAHEVIMGMVDIVDGWCAHPETGQRAATLSILLELQTLFIEAQESLNRHIEFVDKWA